MSLLAEKIIADDNTVDNAKQIVIIEKNVKEVLN